MCLSEKKSGAAIDDRTAADGYITVTNTDIAILSKDGKEIQLPVNGDAVLPLTMGDGKYTVKLMRHLTENTYRPIVSRFIDVRLTDPLGPYLHPNLSVKYDSDSLAAIKAAAICTDLNSAPLKIKAIHDWIAANIKYDYPKAADAGPEYLPSLDETLISMTGICYDYASLFAAMLRSQGVPCRLAIGSSGVGDVRHAWNEAYEDNKWVLYDTERAARGVTADLYTVDYYL